MPIIYLGILLKNFPNLKALCIKGGHLRIHHQKGYLAPVGPSGRQGRLPATLQGRACRPPGVNQVLDEHGIPLVIRNTFAPDKPGTRIAAVSGGQDIDAACGQLAAGQPVVLGARRR